MSKGKIEVNRSGKQAPCPVLRRILDIPGGMNSSSTSGRPNNDREARSTTGLGEMTNLSAVRKLRIRLVGGRVEPGVLLLARFRAKWHFDRMYFDPSMEWEELVWFN